jgi:hypothetical protein
MLTFAQRSEAIQTGSSARSTLHGPARSRQGRESRPVLDSQRAALKPEERASVVGRASADRDPARFEHDLSRIPLHTHAAGTIQTKLAVNAPGDQHEREADSVADKVMGASEPRSSPACACGGGCPKCSSRHDAQEGIQTKPAGVHHAAAAAAPPSVERALS